MSELKPCPFCGGEVDANLNYYKNYSYTINILCPQCGGSSAEFWDEERAIEAWNRRTGNVPTEFHEKIVNAQANRWIKRSKEIERESLEWERKYWDLAKSVGGDPNEDAVDMAIEALERTRWIPVSEGLPTKEDANNALEVLVWDQSSCWHDMLMYGAVEDNDHITHWMPLPKPPEMTREEAGHWDGIAPVTAE